MSSRDKIFMVLELVTGGELFDKVVAEGPMKVGRLLEVQGLHIRACMAAVCEHHVRGQVSAP